MPTIRPEELLALAERLQEGAAAAKGRGETESTIVMLEAVIYLKELGEGAAALKPGDYSPKMATMDAEHRLAISKGRSRRNPLMRAARAAGYNDVTALRAALEGQKYKVSAAFLSMVGTKAKPAPVELLRALKALGIAYEP